VSEVRRNLGDYRNRFGFRQKLARSLWGTVCLLLYRPSPRTCHGWRRFLLRCFGAKVGRGAKPYPKAIIWAPWNLTLGARCWLADGVDCYSVAPITIGDDAVVSQRAVLCAATHDYRSSTFPLVAKPIIIGRGAWVAAEAFIGPGVTLNEGAVAGARAFVNRDVPAWAVVVGNPAVVVKTYTLAEAVAVVDETTQAARILSTSRSEA
jgi:putative colanic acid biosynthesis acetyltransferase WcaF